MDELSRFFLTAIAAVVGTLGLAWVATTIPRKPILAPIICLQAYFWVPQDLWFGGQQGVISLIFLIQVVTLVVRHRSRGGKKAEDGLDAALRYAQAMGALTAVLLGLAFASYLVYGSELTGGFLRYLAKFVGFWMFGFTLIASVRTKEQCMTLGRVFALTGFCAAVGVGLVQYWTGTTFVDSEYFAERYAWFGERYRLVTFGQFDPNYAMLDLIPVTLMAFGLAHTERRGRVLWLGAFLLGVLASVLTFSRSGLVVLGGGLVILGVAAKMYRPKHVAAVGLGVLGVWALFSSQGLESLIQADNLIRLASTQSLDSRLVVMGMAYQGFLDHPLIGLGGTDLRDFISNEMGFRISAHSFYITILFHHGLIGATLIVSFLGMALWALAGAVRRARRPGGEPRWRVFCAVMLACFVSYLALITSISDTLGFYICFFTAMAVVMKGWPARQAAGRVAAQPRLLPPNYEHILTIMPHGPGVS